MKPYKNTLVEKMAMGVIIATVVLMILAFIVNGIISYNLITNPEMIGEWFSKLLSGFNE